MRIDGTPYRTVWFEDGKLHLINQPLLPHRFEVLEYSDYREAVLSLGKLDGFETDLVNRLGLLPGFRNVLVHDYVSLDYERVVEALENMEPIEQFMRIVGKMEGEV